MMMYVHARILYVPVKLDYYYLTGDGVKLICSPERNFRGSLFQRNTVKTGSVIFGQSHFTIK